MNWTDEQKQAILKNGSNILVAAAAGSGKTAVLVERVINKIINQKIDIDKMLIVTFTNAAASEMREKILNSIYKKIEETENIEEIENLQRQIILINKANICTIDSFCLDVIRSNFFEIGVSPNFRIGDKTEIELLKQEVLEDLFEEKYESHDEDFQTLIKTYTSYRDDTPLKDLILNIFSYISSNPYPRKWLNEQIEKFNLKNKNIDFAKTIWGKILLDQIKEELQEYILILQNEAKKLSVDEELMPFQKILQSDITEFEKLINHLDNWDEAYNLANSIEFIKWPRAKTDLPEKENAKIVRDNIKTNIKSKIEQVFVSSSKEAVQDIIDMYHTLNKLKNLIFEFENRFAQKKKEKNILDFYDIEHMALKILVKENEDGTYTRTDIAKKYQNRFVEIAIDEYQDSNLIQEYILTSVSNGNNIFMVGDVKQSIYKFRQAMPELFLEKYKKYSKNKANEKGLKIQLFKNFRSRENILDLTNIIFKNLMSEDLGDIDYNNQEYLNLGNIWDTQKSKNEIDIIDISKNDVELEERLENIEIEAKFVANKIKKLIESKYQVYDLEKQKYRDIQYKDIVILMRSTKDKASVFENELINTNIPVYSDKSAEYIDSIEINTILSLLKIIDNPMQDMPLVTVMRSAIGNFSNNDLIEIRLADRHSDFYTALIKAKLSVSKKLKNKIEDFLQKLDIWREEQEYLALDELIWKIYEDTGFLNYVGLLPNGALRQANLTALFEKAKQYETASFKGLFNFIKFIEKLQIGNSDMSAAKIIGENENVVRIMSIHKSKGLEFPIVFLVSTSTNFNLNDLNKDILLNQELGLGVKYIDFDMQIKYDTLTKLALKEKEFNSIISEEMRILYVALTRAKQKIYITGISKDFEKDKKQKCEDLKIFRNTEDKISLNLRKKSKNYLDWIEYIYFKENKIKDIIDLNIYKKSDLNKILKTDANEKQFKTVEEVANEELEKTKKIAEQFKFEYKYKEDIEIPSNISITEIAHRKQGIKQQKEIEFPKPKFLIGEEEEKVSATRIGTIVHLCMKNLDIAKNYNLQDIKDMINLFIEKGFITKKEAEAIKIEQILQFTKTNIWEDLKQAKEIYKEKAFYINVPANRVMDTKSEANILAQGIIDLFYIDKNDNLVLVDYKTDSIKKGEEQVLINRHEEQLKLYKIALEDALNRKVDKVYIYSTVLGKGIEMKKFAKYCDM